MTLYDRRANFSLMTASRAILLAFAILSGLVALAFLFAMLLSFAADPEGGVPPSYLWIPGVDLLWLIAAPFLRWRKSSAGRMCAYAGLPFLVISILLLALR